MSPRIIVVTGTSTGVGKTVATAALALRAAGSGTVTVVKPVQTGIVDGDSDAGEVHRLTGCGVQEYTALDEPLAPDTAARRQGVRIPPVAEYADRIRVLAEFHDTVVVEGAGGLLVRLDTDGGTILDLAAELAETLSVDLVVVAGPQLGTLNHAELTVGAIRARGLEPAGVVIGAWPAEPGLAERCNAEDLPRVTGLPVLATIPAGVGALDREAFREQSPTWFA
ncbi:dethiobiotin synthase [Nocardioides sp. LS1]|uniref:dethiobiotin synthase n=1 Tax=Nocardioides sp. LS1 TaxID=1027620 RepID=UPI000F61AC13|nr:dethiobiotin synthase [Nocardioides sp. LS1]GCD91971.1 ATP-dependent dethiobiotin synthetase BioD [Nocardioides sp. LS1]